MLPLQTNSLEPGLDRSLMDMHSDYCVSERIFEKVLISKKSADGNKTMKKTHPVFK